MSESNDRYESLLLGLIGQNSGSKPLEFLLPLPLQQIKGYE